MCLVSLSWVMDCGVTGEVSLPTSRKISHPMSNLLFQVFHGMVNDSCVPPVIDGPLRPDGPKRIPTILNQEQPFDSENPKQIHTT